MRLSATWTRQARSGSVTELTEARSSGEQVEDLRQSGRAARVGLEVARRPTQSEIRGATTTQRCGLVALAVGLDVAALLEQLVDHAPLLADIGSSRDRPSLPASALLGGPVGPLLEQLAATLAIAGGVEGDALAIPHAAEGGLVAEQLQRVDRLPTPADQHPVVVVALDHGEDPVVGLA